MKYLADSRAEAEEKVENDWNNQQYVLDNKHFVGAEFHARETERETITGSRIYRDRIEGYAAGCRWVYTGVLTI